MQNEICAKFETSLRRISAEHSSAEHKAKMMSVNPTQVSPNVFLLLTKLAHSEVGFYGDMAYNSIQIKEIDLCGSFVRQTSKFVFEQIFLGGFVLTTCTKEKICRPWNMCTVSGHLVLVSFTPTHDSHGGFLFNKKVNLFS